jgi:hypothetical protein
MMRVWPQSLFAVWLLVGCGGSDSPKESGLAGMYQVISHVKLYQACDGAAEAQTISPLFFVVEDELLDDGLRITVMPCTGRERVSCGGYPTFDLAERLRDGEFLDEQLQGSPDGTGCWLQWTGTYIAKSGAGVRLRTEGRSQTRAAGCDPLPAIASGRTWPCAYVETRETMRL